MRAGSKLILVDKVRQTLTPAFRTEARTAKEVLRICTLKRDRGFTVTFNNDGKIDFIQHRGIIRTISEANSDPALPKRMAKMLQ